MTDMKWSEICTLLPLSKGEVVSLQRILKQVYLSDFGSSIVDDAHKILKKLDKEERSDV